MGFLQETLLKNEQGFTLLELMVVLSILGVLIMLAVPKFSSSVAVANTVRIQSDLQTINTAIAVYQSQNGVYPQNIITDLSPYLSDAARVAPPQGECFLRDGTKLTVTDKAYTLNGTHEQALCQSHLAIDFGRKDRS